MVHLRSIIVFGKEGICSAVHDTLGALCTNVLPSGGSISLLQRGTQHPHIIAAAWHTAPPYHCCSVAHSTPISLPQRGTQHPHARPQRGTQHPHARPQRGTQQPHARPQRGTRHPHARPQFSYTVAKLMLASTDPALHNTCGGVETKMCGRQQNTCHSRQAAHHDGSHGKAVVLVGRVSKATLIHSTISQSVQDGNGTVGLSRPRICSTGLIKSVQRSP
jgi:hypothetical protein